MGNTDRDALVRHVIRRARRRVCIFIAIAGLMFAVFVVETQGTAVGVVGSVAAVGGSILAVASLVARDGRDAAERAWIAVGLAVFGVAFVAVANLF